MTKPLPRIVTAALPAAETVEGRIVSLLIGIAASCTIVSAAFCAVPSEDIDGEEAQAVFIGCEEGTMKAMHVGRELRTCISWLSILLGTQNKRAPRVRRDALW